MTGITGDRAGLAVTGKRGGEEGEKQGGIGEDGERSIRDKGEEGEGGGRDGGEEEGRGEGGDE